MTSAPIAPPRPKPGTAGEISAGQVQRGRREVPNSNSQPRSAEVPGMRQRSSGVPAEWLVKASRSVSAETPLLFLRLTADRLALAAAGVAGDGGGHARGDDQDDEQPFRKTASGQARRRDDQLR